MVNLAYQLPAFPSEGKWTIRVEAMSQVQDYTVYVERYYVPFFEVAYVTQSSFLLIVLSNALTFFLGYSVRASLCFRVG